jgi:hypothetical protein
VVLYFLYIFPDIRVEDVSNLGGGWKMWDFVESRIYLKYGREKKVGNLKRTIERNDVHECERLKQRHHSSLASGCK